MEPFRRLEAIAAPLPRNNIDTDALFPAPFIQRMDIDFARALFSNWRFVDGGPAEEPGFVLNQPAYRSAEILVAGENFGCGSSREHAVWALAAYGIRAVLAKSFGDIFRDNAFKNGLLPVALPAATVDGLMHDLAASPDKRLAIDLEACTIALPGGNAIPFEMDDGRRRRLLDGLDEIGATLAIDAEIARFQTHDRVATAWAWAPVGRDAPSTR